MVHVAYEDVEAYAKWAGKTLPTEAQWEIAARGKLEGKVYTWGDEFSPDGKMMTNCAPNHCLRYRPSTRQPSMLDSGTTHLGFRCVKLPSQNGQEAMS